MGSFTDSAKKVLSPEGKHVVSAGVLLLSPDNEVFLVKPYGAASRLGCWGIPKGHVEDGEDIHSAAIREFYEETGIKLSKEATTFLGEVKTPSGVKTVHCWLAFGTGDEEFKPPRANFMEIKGKMVPECVRGEFFSFNRARELIIAYQMPLLDLAAQQRRDK